MGIDRTRRITFEEVADLYDEVRSGYPDELLEDVIRLSEIPPDGRILEIGCGAGNATLLFARKGYPLLGIELGERLAQFARGRCQAYPNATIVCSAFEDYPLEPRSFDLVISADAFHWIPPEAGYPKVSNALKDTGSVAFFWHVPIDPQTDWSRAVEKVFRQRAPQFENPDRAFSFEWLKDIICQNFETHGQFGDVTVREYRWSEIFSAEKYIKLLRTYSGFREMDEVTRQQLHAGIRTALDGFGGEVEKPFHVALFFAQVKRGA